MYDGLHAAFMGAAQLLAPHLAASDSRIADLGTIRVKCGVEECDVVLVRLDLGVGELLAHRVDGLLVVRAVEDRRARHEHVHARLRDLLDVGHADAAVNLERDVVARLVNHLARLARLVEGGGNELLAAEAGVDRHQQDDVDLVHHVLADVQRRRRVEDEARLAAGGAHEAERAVNVSGRLRVEGDEVGAGVGEVADDGIDRRHHQVDVNRRLDAVVLERLADHRADGEVGHVVVVHDVKVDNISAGSEDILNLLAELGEVSAKDGRRDAVVRLHLQLRGARGRRGRQLAGGGREAHGGGTDHHHD